MESPDDTDIGGPERIALTKVIGSWSWSDRGQGQTMSR
jgi:hypothetical protein